MPASRSRDLWRHSLEWLREPARVWIGDRDEPARQLVQDTVRSWVIGNPSRHGASRY